MAYLFRDGEARDGLVAVRVVVWQVLSPWLRLLCGGTMVRQAREERERPGERARMIEQQQQQERKRREGG